MFLGIYAGDLFVVFYQSFNNCSAQEYWYFFIDRRRNAAQFCQQTLPADNQPCAVGANYENF